MRIKTKFTERDTEDYRLWFSFYKKKDFSGFKLLFESNGYFDPRPQIQTNLTTLILLILPFISYWFIPLSIVLMFYGWPGKTCDTAGLFFCWLKKLQVYLQ